MKLWLSIVSLLVLEANAQREEDFDSGFRAAIFSGIVPSYPESVADIRFSREVSMGEELQQTEVIIQPQVSYSYQRHENYTVILINPDFPSFVAPVQRSALHWLVVNVPGDSISDGTAVATYVPSTSYSGSGCHRFILLVYVQKRALYPSRPSLAQFSVNRFNFSVSSFENEYNLKSLAAATYFRTCSPPTSSEYYCRA